MDSSIVEQMIFKRLCLPSNTDIGELNSGRIKNTKCECDGLSKHIACVMIKKREPCFICAFIWYKYL